MARKKKGQPVHGWLVIDKPAGKTSSQVVGIIKRMLDAQKAGHGGTLDPMATGVLPIALGEATKTVSYIMDDMQAYFQRRPFARFKSVIDEMSEAHHTLYSVEFRGDGASLADRLMEKKVSVLERSNGRLNIELPAEGAQAAVFERSAMADSVARVWGVAAVSSGSWYAKGLAQAAEARG